MTPIKLKVRITLQLRAFSWLVASLILLAATVRAADPTPTPNDNPLLAPSPQPLGYPQFDKIRNEHFQPAIEQGMAAQLKEVEAIAGNSEKPTFDNTIVALERSGRLLARAQRTFGMDWMRS
jgi:peptidyl-dipeptidase Dcp